MRCLHSVVFESSWMHFESHSKDCTTRHCQTLQELTNCLHLPLHTLITPHIAASHPIIDLHLSVQIKIFQTLVFAVHHFLDHHLRTLGLCILVAGDMIGIVCRVDNPKVTHRIFWRLARRTTHRHPIVFPFDVQDMYSVTMRFMPAVANTRSARHVPQVGQREHH